MTKVSVYPINVARRIYFQAV